MRVSTGGRYGLRVMLDIALNGAEGPVQRQEIADRQEISAEYIAHLIQELTKAGLVRSIKGPGGGYYLTRPPGAIRIGEIFRAVEGPLTTVFCVMPESEKTCRRKDSCAANLFWGNLAQVIDRYLDSVSLAELAALANGIESGGTRAALLAEEVETSLPKEMKEHSANSAEY